jgi:hypothetical protein
MPSKRAKPDRLLETALEALAGALTDARVPWAVIGGVAVIARGVRRFTTDIDVAVRGDAISVESLLVSLARFSIAPRINDAVAFAETHLVLLLRHRESGVDLDVSLAWSAFEHDALATSTMTAFGRVLVPMCTAESLVVFKAIAGRPKDIEDAEALLTLHADIDRTRARRRVAELAALAETPELLDAFERLLRRV